MSRINALRLHIRVGVYIALLFNILHKTECLELAQFNRRSDQRLLEPDSKDSGIYVSGDQCILEADDPYKQWIDPYEMLPSNKDRKISLDAPGKQETDNKKQRIDPFEMFPSNNMNTKTKLDASVKREKQCEVYMQRFINLLLRRSRLTNYNLQHGSEKQINFDFIIRGEDLAILQKYGESGRSEDIFAVNDVLTRLFGSAEGTVFSQKPSSFEYNINIQFYQHITDFISKVYSYIVNSPEASIPISVVLVSVTAFYLVYITRSYKLAMFTVMFIIFAANFGITWYRMYQEEMSVRFYAEMKHSGAPPHCKGEQLSWFEHLKLMFTGEDCEKYYKKHFTSPMSQVSLNAVFSESVSVLFLQPSHHIAKAYGDFITTATGSVPWWVKPIVFPLVCIAPILLVVMLLALLLNYQISINPFTGFRIAPHLGQSRCCKEQEENKQCIEKSSDTGHSSKSQQISNALESAVASNEVSPLILMNWPAIEKFLHTSQKEKVETATKGHNNKVCKNCQIVIPVPSDGSGDSSQFMPNSSCIKKNVNNSQKDYEHKQLKESEVNIKQRITCLGDCCTHNETSNLLPEESGMHEKAEEEREKGVQQMGTVTGNNLCQCKHDN